MKTLSTPLDLEPTVTFHGAAQSVTGSMHRIEFGGRSLLLDCGRLRGRHEDILRQQPFPFDPADIEAVILSHAHIDHCGNLPRLVREGFRGSIYCTPATRDLIAVMLADSARIHEDDAAVAHSIAAPGSTHVLYSRSEASRAVDQCISVEYGEEFSPTPDCRRGFLDAGHILGSAMVALTLQRGKQSYRITFTGDLGRRGLPFVREPALVPAADLIISESTYGGRLHDNLEGMGAKLSAVVRRTAARGGRVLIPAFSLGRTQIVVHYLRQWMRDGLLPQLPLYVDSPLAEEIGTVYERYEDLLIAGDGVEGPPIQTVASHEEHRELACQSGPAVVVASGGMCDGGRIVSHLKHHLDDPRSSIVLVSYQAPHSVGAELLEKRPTVRMHGRRWNKWAEVVQINGFSGHADHQDFLALLGPAAGATGKVRLVHGELPQAEALAEALRKQGFADVRVPHREESVQVVAV